MKKIGGASVGQNASASEVEAFLRRFKAVMEASGLNLWDRGKNDSFMSKNGFLHADVEDAIRRLRDRNYHRGPMPDDNPSRASGEVWVFQTEHLGFDVYLKLKLVGPAGSPQEAACLSFHEQEREMTTPLQVSGRGPLRPTRRRGRQ